MRSCAMAGPMDATTRTSPLKICFSIGQLLLASARWTDCRRERHVERSPSASLRRTTVRRRAERYERS
jgi:hypothetical protein